MLKCSGHAVSSSGVGSAFLSGWTCIPGVEVRVLVLEESQLKSQLGVLLTVTSWAGILSLPGLELLHESKQTYFDVWQGGPAPLVRGQGSDPDLSVPK